MKFLVAGMLWFFGIFQAVAATPEDIQLEIDSAKRSVIELSSELSAIEKQLISPISTKASLYLALSNGKFFTPMSITVSGNGITPVNYLYTEKEIQALQFGAVQPLADLEVAPGNHLLKVVVRGRDENKRVRDLVYEGVFRKNGDHLKLLLSITDNTAQRSAVATLKAW
ncbi:hypothetical protein [Candidatus Thalassolituus haligoni]|jgi:hypothetical protein|uniref:hypothetical protein n=1 Tax=Candidatus Thalassolituus haligoni TaxID=3100113 RepID=UPI0035182E69|tara:strand:- start:34458 stop:34964 length:507 start_codon:yes stop_codon:yes gene_type:complete